MQVRLLAVFVPVLAASPLGWPRSRSGSFSVAPPVSAIAAFASDSPVASPTPGFVDRPPQFVVFSFDGGGSVDLWKEWRAAAKKTGAHFTFFVSGVYLLEREHKTAYIPPDHLAGRSAIGFLPVPKGRRPEPTLRALLAQIDAAHAEGHEIGTHFNGHWCGDGGVSEWDAEDWREEIDEFRSLFSHVSENNALDPPVTMTTTTAAIVGARSPCFDGDRREREAALASAGFRYDASRPGFPNEWPRRENEIWSFSITPLALPGVGHSVLATDYNLFAHDSGLTDVTPERAAAVERDAYSALMAAFDASYYGRRAPMVVGSHFEHWSHAAYARAIRHFARTVCRKEEVRCDSFEEVADWLDGVPAADLASYRRGRFPKRRRPVAVRAVRGVRTRRSPQTR